MVSDYQFDPLKNQITHIDFLAINMSEERTVEVQVQLVGEAVGAKEGGVVEQPLFNLEVTATPENIPETIEVDISELQVNDSLAVSDIKISGDFTIENDPEDSIATEEPEVVGEDKEDDEEENKED
ncbi:ribosomal protein L25, Ctc-form [Mycobacteroides abscessus subsp. massiliense]|nr:ribosomal protein L25, Ctc-form [Mycobacteroides abscessus subsp. massiliense]